VTREINELAELRAEAIRADYLSGKVGGLCAEVAELKKDRRLLTRLEQMARDSSIAIKVVYIDKLKEYRIDTLLRVYEGKTIREAISRAIKEEG
jgi:hypothetical protein